MELRTYTTDGKAGKNITVSDEVFGQLWSPDLVHQVVISMQSNARQGSAHTKDRSEVSGGGRKPWRQKGTGRARHGSSRSPIWRSGGVTFGPRNEKDYSKKVNKKMARQALAVVLSAKLRENQIIGVTGTSFPYTSGKTKDAQGFLTMMEGAEGFETLNTLTNKNNILVVIDQPNEETIRGFKNIPHVTLVSSKDLSVWDVAMRRYVVLIDPTAIDATLGARLRGTYVADKRASEPETVTETEK